MAWDDFIEKSDRKILTLIECEPSINLTEWGMSGTVYFTNLNYQINGVYFEVLGVDYNGVALTERDSVSDLEGETSGYYYDVPKGMMADLVWDSSNEEWVWDSKDGRLTWGGVGNLYVKLAGSEDPNDADNIVVVKLWVGFKNLDNAYLYNSNYYHPLILQNGISGFNLSRKDFFAGSTVANGGTFQIANIEKGFYKLVKNLRWKNAAVRILIGEESFTYSDFKKVFLGRVNTVLVDDDKVLFNCIDSKTSFAQDFPLQTITLADYPNLVNCEGQYKPIIYGTVTKAPAYIVDDDTAGTPFGTLLVFDADNCSVSQPTKIYKVLSGVTSEYTVPDVAKFDLSDWSSLGVVHLIDDGTGIATNWSTATWYADVANSLDTATEIIWDLHERFLGYVAGNKDTDSWAAVATDFPDALMVYLPEQGNKLISGQELLNNLELSCNASLVYSGDGKVYLLRDSAQVDEQVFDVLEWEMSDFQAEQDDSNIAKRVVLNYPITDVSTWSADNAGIKAIDSTNLDVVYTSEVKEDKVFKVYQTSISDITDLLEIYKKYTKIPITTVRFKTPNLRIFNTLPVRKIQLTRGNAPSVSGEYDREILTIQEMAFNFLTGETDITALDTLDVLGEEACFECFSCETCFYTQGFCVDCFACEICVDYEWCGNCQNCDVVQLGCVICNTCDLCFTDEGGGCSRCDTCQRCVTAQSGCVNCYSCQNCYTCDSCYTSQGGCITCNYCQSCVTCQVCYNTYFCGFYQS